MLVGARRFLLLICIVLVAGCAGPAAKHESVADPVILISIDGFRADYLDRGRTPTLASLAASGVRADALKPSFPTLTFPNHYTLVTGLYPDHHGIVDNRMIDPAIDHMFVYKDSKAIADPAWWRGEPLWVGVENSGRHAATMFWPGTNVAIDGVRPSHWIEFNGKVSPERRVDQLLAWFDLRGARKPAFYTLYFEQVDHAGHDYGPDSPEVDAALREVDAALARLVAGLEARGAFARTNLVIVSDHGMTSTSPERVIYLDDLIPLDDAGLVTSGILAGMNPKPDRASGIESVLLAKHDHMRCWRKSEIPARFHYGTNPRVPALLCLADDGWLVSTREAVKNRKHFSLGEHGYDNDDPAMRALFVAHGPALKSGVRVRELDNVDVYPLVAHLLALPPRHVDGRYEDVREMLVDP